MANKKITELTALTDPDANDLLAIVDDPSGSPVTKQITATKLVKSLNNQAATFVIAASDSLHRERADYVCDGVDDQVEIQAAIDALPSGGGKLVLSDGKFVLTAPVLLNANSVWIRGNKGTQIDLDHSGGRVNSAIHVQADHVEISGINFEFTDTTVISPPRSVESPADSEYSDVHIHDCRFIGIKTSGAVGSFKHTTIGKAIESAAGKNWNIHNNYFKGCSWEGISMGSIASSNYPESAIITQNVVVGLDDRCFGGIVVEHGARHCVIANNVVYGMRNPLGYGIYAIGGDGCTGAQDTVVVGNSVFDCDKEGIRFSNNAIGAACTGNIVSGTSRGIVIETASKELNISGNLLRRISDEGIRIANAHSIHIVGNYISGAKNCISFATSSKLSIIGNSLSYAVETGILQLSPGGSSQVVIQNNILKNMNTKNGAYPHIYLCGTAVNDLTISGNVFRDTQATDITTLAAGASIGNTIITVDDVDPFSYNEAIEIGADIVRITALNYYDKQISFTPALANNHALGSAVSGKDTAYRLSSSLGSTSSLIMNNWKGIANPIGAIAVVSGNIGMDGNFFLGDGETQTFRKTINYDDASPVVICNVDDGHAITDVWVEVTTTFDDGGAKLKIGDGGNILGFLCSADGTNNDIDLSSTGYYGVNDDQREAYLWDNINSHGIQKVYTSSDTIDATIIKTDGSQGQAIVHVKITKIG